MPERWNAGETETGRERESAAERQIRGRGRRGSTFRCRGRGRLYCCRERRLWAREGGRSPRRGSAGGRRRGDRVDVCCEVRLMCDLCVTPHVDVSRPVSWRVAPGPGHHTMLSVPARGAAGMLIDGQLACHTCGACAPRHDRVRKTSLTCGRPVGLMNYSFLSL